VTGPQTSKQVQNLVDRLSDRDGLKRRKVRRTLESMGPVIGPYMIEALSSEHAHVRWEAAKILTTVMIPSAAPALVTALMDESFEVQWLAAEALISLGTLAVVPLLEGLIRHPTSINLRQGAHHVLSDLERAHLLDTGLHEVIEDLRSIVPSEPFPLVARRALENLSRSATENSDPD
jgi:hypothetical protein